MQLLQHDKEDYFLSIPGKQKKNHHQDDILEVISKVYKNTTCESILLPLFSKYNFTNQEADKALTSRSPLKTFIPQNKEQE